MSEATTGIYRPNEVFAFCGHIADEGPERVQSGFVVADTAQVAIQGMQDYGFLVTALSSLADTQETLAILELLAERNPAVEPHDYLDLTNAGEDVRSFSADQVFTYIGKSEQGSRYFKMGFAIAPTAAHLEEYLDSTGFDVTSMASLRNVRDTAEQLEQIAKREIDENDFCLFNMKYPS